MSLEHLDDLNPPELDAARWRAVAERSCAISRTRRYRRLSGSFAVIVAIGGLTAWAVVSSRRTVVSVATAVPTSTTAPTITAPPSTTPPSTTPLNASDWITVELQVDHPVVVAGQDVTGTMLFDNRRSTPVRLTDGECAASWTVAVGSGTTAPDVAFAASCESPAGARSFPPGVTRVAFRAATTYTGCGGSGDLTLPQCSPGGGLPPLAPGVATVWFVSDGPVPHLVAPPEPVTIQITAP